MIDWNWFFSAFAQCAAALIGIIAAFTISKLLSESEKVEDHTNEINKLLLKRVDLIRRINSRFFDWHDRLNIEYSFELKEAIENGDFKNIDENEKLDQLFSILPNLYGVDNCLDYLSKKIESVEPVMVPIGSGISMAQRTLIANIPPEGIWDKLGEEKETINNLKLEAEDLIDCLNTKKIEVKSKQNNTVPIKATIYILMIGFLLTVIYPLHFIPIKPEHAPQVEFTILSFLNSLISLKGILLAILAITINGLFAYFLSIILKIEKQYEIIHSSITPADLELTEYSRYFRKP